jgi:hypothetical protein
MTGSQWTGLTVSLICLVTLVVWALRARSGTSPPQDREVDAEALAG